ncbi:HDOD domain-containing protein [Maridesulfovibrio sp.]|uniref:HDOD domain-containing protein n=1 Tax=Maridesulfovibrio sp. TaxID=2795000 RepID=UPI0029F56C43|nr:HDOD domain-containing protein [Maridesulfovibrio sp.]
MHCLFLHAGNSDLVRLLKKEAFKTVYKQLLCDPDHLRPRVFPDNIKPWNGERPKDPSHFLSGSLVLPSLPRVQIQLQEILDDPDSTIEDLVEIISNEPKLSAAVLRLVNCGLYQLDKKVETPAKAVKILGFEKAGSLTLGTVSLSLFKRHENPVLNLEKFWKHSIACGVIAQELAKAAKHGDHDRFFAGGLMHDLGLHIIFESDYGLAVELYRLANRDGYDLYKAEKELLGFNHADVGGYLLNKWNFPRQLVAAAWGHHNPRKVKTDPDAMVTHVADFIAQALGYDLGISPVIGFIDDTAWKKLGISGDKVIEMLPDIRILIDDVFNIFDE